jgi:hypothetical protein
MMSEMFDVADVALAVEEAGEDEAGEDEAGEERYLRETLAMLQESYAKAAKPYIDRLVSIHAMRPLAPMIMPVGQAQALGLQGEE